MICDKCGYDFGFGGFATDNAGRCFECPDYDDETDPEPKLSTKTLYKMVQDIEAKVNNIESMLKELKAAKATEGDSPWWANYKAEFWAWQRAHKVTPDK